MKAYLNSAIDWARRNPKPLLIALGCALAFNFVLYPVITPAYYTYRCDSMPTSMAVVVCHIEHNQSFLGSFFH